MFFSRFAVSFVACLVSTICLSINSASSLSSNGVRRVSLVYFFCPISPLSKSVFQNPYAFLFNTFSGIGYWFPFSWFRFFFTSTLFSNESSYIFDFGYMWSWSYMLLDFRSAKSIGSKLYIHLPS